MSRSRLTILTNICLIEDQARQQVVMQYRSSQRYSWSGYAFPGGHVEEKESLHEAVVREVLEETGLTIHNPKLVGVKNWETDRGERYIVFCYRATEFSGSIRSTEEGAISWVKKADLPNLELAYDMLPLYQMMTDDRLSEFYYRSGDAQDWEKILY